MHYLLITFFTYCVISLFFFIFPTLIRKKRTYANALINFILNSKSILLAAHRGGSRECLENTIEAFRNGIKQGANCLEMDVCLTYDKKIVVIHDSYLQRMCGIGDFVEYYNYNELPKFQDVVRIDFTIEDTRETKKCATPYIPLLEDVFKEFPGVMINVELKTPSEEFIQLMNQLIIKYKREDHTVWGCRNTDYSIRLKEVNPNIKSFFSEKSALKVFIFFILGLLPFFDFPEDSFQVPLYTDDFYLWKKKEAVTKEDKKTVNRMFTFMKILQFFYKPIFYHLKKRGITPILWVVNNQEEFDRGIKTGCCGLMTDSPSILRNYLKSTNLYIENMQ